MLREVDIVDAHHHFINLPDFVYPWIESRQPALRALLPNYYDAAHPYLPQDYRADVSAVPSRPRSRVSSEQQTVSRRRSGFSNARTV